MRETTGNIWDYRDSGIIIFTTNGSTNRRGEAILGTGCARQAGERFPGLCARLGALLLAEGNNVHDLGNGLVSFPVEETPWSLPDLALIARSARQLRTLADRMAWQLVVVPRPGCGGGGLSWGEVRPLLLPWFDDRFLVITEGR
jgi:hypothetical protein